MENKKVSKKALKALLKDSMREAIGRLELPAPSRKVEKLISKSSKRIATEFKEILKKENKKTKKSLTYVEDVLNGKNKKSKKSKVKTIGAV